MVALPATHGARWTGAVTQAIRFGVPLRRGKRRMTHPNQADLDCFDRPLTRPVTHLVDAQRFLHQCRYTPDEVIHGKTDYWMHPIDFERWGRGDCEDHALWTWRALHDAGYDVRFVVGAWQTGGHAWVHLYDGDACYIIETTHKHPTRRASGRGYVPQASFKRIEADLQVYSHDPDFVEFMRTLPKRREFTDEQWPQVDELIFAGRKEEAIRLIRGYSADGAPATRLFLDRYELLRRQEPQRFTLDDDAYWDDWRHSDEPTG